MNNSLFILCFNSIRIQARFIKKSISIFALILFICAFFNSKSEAAIRTTCTGTNSVTFSPSLSSSTYYFTPTDGTVVYRGVATWKLTSCTWGSGGFPVGFSFDGLGTNTSGILLNVPGLTLSKDNSSVLTATCGAVSLTYASQNLVGYLFNSNFGSNVTCTIPIGFMITANSNATSSSAGSVTATQIITTPTYGTAWFMSSAYNAAGTIVLNATGQVLTFAAAGCTATNPSQTVTLPTVSVSTLNTIGYSPWTSWSFGLNSCVNISSSITAKVTFAYTELDGTGSSIIAPTGGTATHVGVQLGYGGNALANGTATSLGTMSSATSYTYTMQARYAKASGQTATAGTITGATATYLMTYN